MNTTEHIPYIRNGKKWYFLSIFYAREKWRELISDITHFYKKRQSIFETYLISFSNEKGEHLEVTFVTAESDNDNYSDEIQKYFQCYLSQNPSVSNQSFPYGKVIWCNYSNNSLTWDRFKLPYYSDRYIHFHLITMELFFQQIEDDFSVDAFLSVGIYLITKGLFCIDYNEQKKILSRFFYAILNSITKDHKIDDWIKKQINKFDVDKVCDAIESYKNENLNEYTKEQLNWMNEVKYFLKNHNYELLFFLICQIIGLTKLHQIIILGLIDIYFDSSKY